MWGPLLGKLYQSKVPMANRWLGKQSNDEVDPNGWLMIYEHVNTLLNQRTNLLVSLCCLLLWVLYLIACLLLYLVGLPVRGQLLCLSKEKIEIKRSRNVTMMMVALAWWDFDGSKHYKKGWGSYQLRVTTLHNVISCSTPPPPSSSTTSSPPSSSTSSGAMSKWRCE